jgi:hypothetical protein
MDENDEERKTHLVASPRTQFDRLPKLQVDLQGVRSGRHDRLLLSNNLFAISEKS